MSDKENRLAARIDRLEGEIVALRQVARNDREYSSIVRSQARELAELRRELGGA